MDLAKKKINVILGKSCFFYLICNLKNQKSNKNYQKTKEFCTKRTKKLLKIRMRPPKSFDTVFSTMKKIAARRAAIFFTFSGKQKKTLTHWLNASEQTKVAVTATFRALRSTHRAQRSDSQ